MTHLIDYRGGWARVQMKPETLVGPWTEVGDGPMHAVPADNNMALCGTACISYDGQPFTAKPGHCRTCLLELRTRAYM